MRNKAWWTEAYDLMQELNYDYHYVDLDSAKEEIRFIKDTLSLADDAKILDLGCGNGRHIIELAKEGYQITGLDYSEKMLKMAAEVAIQEGVEIELIQGDMRDIKFNEGYDGIIIMDGSFGIFSDQDNAKLLNKVSQALKIGGRLLIESFNPYYMLYNQGISYEREGDKTFIKETTFDIYQGRVIDQITALDHIEGEKRKMPKRSYRAYTIPELKNILSKFDLINLEFYGYNQDFIPSIQQDFDAKEDAVIYTVAKRGK